MSKVRRTSGGFTVTAYVGDAKTLLAFDLDKARAKSLCGFTIQVAPLGVRRYYLYNTLQYEKPGDHAQVATEPPNSSINAPIHKFRWLHVPGTAHQGTQPVFGKYTYTVTPRACDSGSQLLPLDPSLSVSVSVDVKPFVKGKLALGFTRGYVQSQGFVNHFGQKAAIRPPNHALLFDLDDVVGTSPKGEPFTYQNEYEWLGFTARQRIMELLDEVVAKKSLHLDVFAYDLNTPEVVDALLTLAGQGRVRIILDNAGLHHSKRSPKPEDEFEAMFQKRRKGAAAILRGKFGRYAHDKIFIVSDSQGPRQVMTGSTNFSVTGLYVNSNHVLLFSDRKVATTYQQLFDAAWAGKARRAPFLKTPLASAVSSFGGTGVPKMDITFSPHEDAMVDRILGDMVKRVNHEGSKAKSTGSVFFAVMQLDGGDSPIWKALRALHAKDKIFSMGISDSTQGTRLYAPGKRTGLLVTGKPGKTTLPKPFNQVPSVGGHQVHHKFVVCGFDRPDAVVYCGSSNLATGGEKVNGDNLLAIRDPDVATVFAIEAVGLVDHFQFLDRYKKKGGKKKSVTSPKNAAVEARWFLSVGSGWTKPYFDGGDLHSVDRRLFG